MGVGWGGSGQANSQGSLQAATPTWDVCAPLPLPSGEGITITSESDLRDRATNAPAGTTLLLPAGTYAMAGYVHVVNDGLSLRGATGDRDDVILDFGGMIGGHFGILVDGDDVTIADLTIRNATDHGVSIQGVDRPTLYNLHIQDVGDQLVKVNPVGDGSEDGVLACSRLEYTTSAPDSYTNGISAHRAHRWVVRDNAWYRIRAADNTPAPTILFWSGSTDTVVERNLLIDCYQGIAFGNASHSSLEHTGGIVRNNVIYAGQPHDVAVEMVHAEGWLVAHNTVILLDPRPGQTWGMEARFGDTSGSFAYNLSNMDVVPNRDGALATSLGDVTTAEVDWFVDAAAGDLHLRSTAAGAIDQAAAVASVSSDLDGDPRPMGPAPDVGADEFGTPPPTGLRATQGVEAAGQLTVTLKWTPSRRGITTTLRHYTQSIDGDNWDVATLITDGLPGETEVFTTRIPYGGGPAYFALRSADGTGTWSDVSANGFWPHFDVYLPLVLRACD